MPFACPKCRADVAPIHRACPSCGETVTDFLREFNENPLDGKYRILAVLGIGGMGEVYKAQHVHLNALRVIKLMRSNITAELDAHDRFLREARAAIRIQHPNVAALFDFSTLGDGSHYMVWEFIDGTNLLEYVRDRGFLTPEIAVDLAIQALLGLEAIHKAGFVHRDVSPENLMVTRDEDGRDRIKIIDLGIAKERDAEEEKTKTGLFVGKLKYCSPEQLGMLKPGERIDGRADIYSFGLVLYHMLTGVPAFQADSPHPYLVFHTTQMPKPLITANPRVNVPASLEQAVFRAVAKNRDERFATALEFARALEAALNLPAGTVAFGTLGSTLSSVPVPSSAYVDTETKAGELPVIRTEPGLTPQPEETTGTLKSRLRKREETDPAAIRRAELMDQVVTAIQADDFQKADVVFQTLRMHLGVKGENDADFKQLRRELETRAEAKEDWFVGEIERARGRGEPKEVSRILNERDQKLGRRFAQAGYRTEIEQWLRKRSELFEQARAAIRREDYRDTVELLDELGAHLGSGAAHDQELKALRKVYGDASIETNERIVRSLEKAKGSRELTEARRLLLWYETKFGSDASKDPRIQSVDDWVAQHDPAWRSGSKRPVTMMPSGSKSKGRWRGVLFFLLVLVIGLAAVGWYFRETLLPVAREEVGDQFPDVLGKRAPKGPSGTGAPVQRPPALDEAASSRSGTVWKNPKDGLEYVWIPAGSVEIGCASGDRLCEGDERPAHPVVVSGFWIGRTEVTVDAWSRFAAQQGDQAPSARGDVDRTFVDLTGLRPGGSWKIPIAGREEAQEKWPVAAISWSEAEAYCRWTGGRLPTEAEWEYVAREGSRRTIWAWGDRALPGSRVANLADDVAITAFKVPERRRKGFFSGYLDGYDNYAPAGSFEPNAFGLHDLSGNVWEWCGDWYDAKFYGMKPPADTAGPGNGTQRVIRGGSWASVIRDSRVSARGHLPPQASSPLVGCRCVIR